MLFTGSVCLSVCLSAVLLLLLFHPGTASAHEEQPKSGLIADPAGYDMRPNRAALGPEGDTENCDAMLLQDGSNPAVQGVKPDESVHAQGWMRSSGPSNPDLVSARDMRVRGKRGAEKSSSGKEERSRQHAVLAHSFLPLYVAAIALGSLAIYQFMAYDLVTWGVSSVESFCIAAATRTLGHPPAFD